MRNKPIAVQILNERNSLDSSVIDFLVKLSFSYDTNGGWDVIKV